MEALQKMAGGPYTKFMLPLPVTRKIDFPS